MHETAHKDDRTTADPVDGHVGARIRQVRRARGVNQEQLAESLGLTYQQVQKYERAANRVSASKLYQIARLLETPVSAFFEGLEATDAKSPDVPPAPDLTAFLQTAESSDIALWFPQIRTARQRKRVAELIRSMVEDEPEPRA
ncbi:helix-turn-helix transcriptional regulator [Caulobacter segnis]|uniref:helix-turn-helix domain-containing protein n=1 Tax=Caulobacter segnis TaxID=88688 RepID=UPI00240FFD7F|nr:helix-turn-helix transcriptional regulator [Caulobacter segnis]MDG2520240.1 helix-turn-helix transcriptional regulator [Caulobacter segnis]